MNRFLLRRTQRRTETHSAGVPRIQLTSVVRGFSAFRPGRGCKTEIPVWSANAYILHAPKSSSIRFISVSARHLTPGLDPLGQIRPKKRNSVEALSSFKAGDILNERGVVGLSDKWRQAERRQDPQVARRPPGGKEDDHPVPRNARGSSAHSFPKKSSSGLEARLLSNAHFCQPGRGSASADRAASHPV